MGTNYTALVLLLLVAVVTTIAACVVIYRRKRRQLQNTAEAARRKAEEKRRQVEVVTVRKAEEVQKRCEAEETQGKVKENEQPRRGVEVLHKTKEDDRGQKEHSHFEQHATTEAKQLESLKAGIEDKRAEPGKRGGRPRAPTQDCEKQSAQETKYRRLKPEILCFKRERQWIIAVEVPENILENSGLQVFQNTSLLTRDEYREDCWRLEQAFGELIIRWNENEDVQETSVPLMEGNYFLFKLSGQHQNEGRRVKFPSSGLYLVIAPDNWERDDALSEPPLRAEPVSLTGYKAHFFDFEKDGDRKIAFHNLAGESFGIESKTSQFELVGNRLNEGSEKMGPLFSERPPQIRALDNQAWKDVGTIVVGEEGSGKGRWRTAFGPVRGPVQQDLPSEVVARKGGWYFLRFYDTNDNLLESLDFRFLSTLHEIKIVERSFLPSEDGHKQTTVELIHESGCTVQPADSAASSVAIDPGSSKTILTISPKPACDETHWRVGPAQDEPVVEVTILVERLWWAIGEEDKEPSEWQDRPITLQFGDFAATLKKTLWLRLPRRRWVDEVLVGFEEQKARRFTVKVMEKTVAISLREFGDAQKVREAGITPLNLWICHHEKKIHGTLCKLIISICCNFCDFNTLIEDDMFCHIESKHMEDFFRPLTPEEVRESNPLLPTGIYQCSFCDFYVKSDDPINPTSAISRHIQEDCVEARKEARLKNEPVKIKFRTISDVDEIRRKVKIRDYPRKHKCKICNCVLDEATQNDMMQHLIENHRNMLYSFR